ncbi:ubiquinone biosynthesis O-methyltransferase-like [Schistocerca gregaria]|uniref:ubiquinone biosynthesis O-methyltransferase-like n=1 Tax=Schistocerca gregaria TaxID=7010 RepID=UPI00211E3E65|nr:ubiquinone biosynthesis O-methyltransferase-like [Schistocerca gregaria]
MASAWWDPSGPTKLLHRMNIARVKYMRHRICEEAGINVMSAKPFQGLNFLDAGCGGGLLTESLARLGGTVTGIDASYESIVICKDRSHHEESPGERTYLHSTIGEKLSTQQKALFDVVCCMEVLEHVDHVEYFLDQLVDLTKPGGHIFLSTINRTLRSFAMTILVAEYLARLTPVGTHDWTKYIKPQELVSLLRRRQCYILDVAGMDYELDKEAWALNTRDVSCNYVIHARRPQD